MIIPDRIFPLAGAETGDGGDGRMAGNRRAACAPCRPWVRLQDGTDGLGGVHDHLVGKVVYLSVVSGFR